MVNSTPIPVNGKYCRESYGALGEDRDRLHSETCCVDQRLLSRSRDVLCAQLVLRMEDALSVRLTYPRKFNAVMAGTTPAVALLVMQEQVTVACVCKRVAKVM